MRPGSYSCRLHLWLRWQSGCHSGPTDWQRHLALPMNCLLNKRKGMGNRSRIWRTSIRFNTRVKSPIIIEDLRTLSFCYCCWSRDRTVGLCESHKCSSPHRAQSAFHSQCQLLRFGVVKGCQCIIWCNSKRGWDCRRAGSWDNFRKVRNPWGRLHLPMLNMWGRLAERGAWELKLYINRLG